MTATASPSALVRAALRIGGLTIVCLLALFTGESGTSIPKILVLGVVFAVLARVLERRPGAYLTHLAAVVALCGACLAFFLGRANVGYLPIFVGMLLANVVLSGTLGLLLGRWMRPAEGREGLGLLQKLSGGLVVAGVAVVAAGYVSGERAERETIDRQALASRLFDAVTDDVPADTAEARALLRREAAPEYVVEDGEVRHGYGGRIDFRREGRELVLAYEEFPNGKTCDVMLWKNADVWFWPRARSTERPDRVDRGGSGMSMNPICAEASTVTIEHVFELDKMDGRRRRRS